jgi:polysaccharide pyruvyl transferase WcaK-like protein
MLGESFDEIIPMFYWRKPIDWVISDSGGNAGHFAEQFPDDYNVLVKSIKECDAVSVCGEGILLFTSPIRPDLSYFWVVFYLCIMFKKPFFLVNAGISPPALLDGNGLRFGEPDAEILKETLRLLRFAELVTVRDAISYDFVKKYDDVINVVYIPDALFSMYDFYDQYGSDFDRMLKTPQFVLSHDRKESPFSKFDFEKNYVLLSGSAFAARYGGDVKTECFTRLALTLRDMLRGYDTELYLLESCDGDTYLRLDVTETTGIPYIPVTTNIFMLGRILGRCHCLVSGRFHPSIFASLGGASLILMGSDSHKIAALPDMLQLSEIQRTVFPSVPNSRQTEEIASAVERVIKRNEDREITRRVARQNGEKSKQLAKMMVERL